jgi:hypothetical protein
MNQQNSKQEARDYTLKPGRVYFIHIRNYGDGALTAAIRLCQDSNDSVDVAVAFCSPKDQFSRKKGRLIAEGRLRSGKLFYSNSWLDLDKSAMTQVRALLNVRDILYMPIPEWAHDETT